MTKKKASSAVAVAATLMSAGSSARAEPPAVGPDQFNPFAARPPQSSTDPLAAPPAPGDRRTRPRPERAEQDQPDEPELDRMFQAFGFLGFNVTWVTSRYSGVYTTFPRIAPSLGGGLRIKPDADFSAQAELALDFVGGSYLYPPLAYVYAATYLNLPLLARHRIAKSSRSRKHFTWGLQFSQKLGDSYNYTILGIPVQSYPGSGYGYSLFYNRMLSAAIGYQTRKYRPHRWGVEFEMRLNVGLLALGEADDFAQGVSGFTFRWNFVPPTAEK